MSSEDNSTAANGGKKKFDMKPTQAAASGMAAVTAAVLGSELGWAGSVAGAGIASVVTTLASTFYQHTLDRTKNSVKEKVVQRTAPFQRPSHGPVRPPAGRPGMQGPPSYPAQRPQHGVRQPVRPQPAQPVAPQPAVPLAQQPTQRQTTANTGDQTRRTFAAIDPATVQLGNMANARTEVVPPVPQQDRTHVLAQQPGSPADSVATQVIAPAAGTEKRKLRWPLIVALSLVATVFGMLVLTGIEAVNGGNSVWGGPGFTVTGQGNSGGGNTDSGGDENNQVPGGTSTTTEQDQPSEAPTTTSEAPTSTTEAPTTTTAPPTTTTPKNQGGLLPGLTTR